MIVTIRIGVWVSSLGGEGVGKIPWCRFTRIPNPPRFHRLKILLHVFSLAERGPPSAGMLVLVTTMIAWHVLGEGFQHEVSWTPVIDWAKATNLPRCMPSYSSVVGQKILGASDHQQNKKWWGISWVIPLPSINGEWRFWLGSPLLNV